MLASVADTHFLSCTVEDKSTLEGGSEPVLAAVVRPVVYFPWQFWSQCAVCNCDVKGWVLQGTRQA